jgi:hypothetical protein
MIFYLIEVQTDISIRFARQTMSFGLALDVTPRTVRSSERNGVITEFLLYRDHFKMNTVKKSKQFLNIKLIFFIKLFIHHIKAHLSCAFGRIAELLNKSINHSG